MVLIVHCFDPLESSITRHLILYPLSPSQITILLTNWPIDVSLVGQNSGILSSNGYFVDWGIRVYLCYWGSFDTHFQDIYNAYSIYKVFISKVPHRIFRNLQIIKKIVSLLFVPLPLGATPLKILVRKRYLRIDLFDKSF